MDGHGQELNEVSVTTESMIVGTAGYFEGDELYRVTDFFDCFGRDRRGEGRHE